MILGADGKVGGAGPRIGPSVKENTAWAPILGPTPPTFAPAPQDHPTISLGVDEIIRGVDAIILGRMISAIILPSSMLL